MAHRPHGGATAQHPGAHDAFWHNHLPTEFGAIFNPRLTYVYDQLLRTQCLGNFRTLIHDISIDGAMLVYLNGYLNTAAAPDENYARELMELFTLGEGSGYTEEDVQAAARVLTGWTVRETDALGDIVLPYVAYRPSQHVTDDKQFSAFFNNTVIQGQTGQAGGETELNALLDMILAKEEVSKFICREVYRFFVHGEIDASAETNVIEPLAEIFRDNAAAPDQMRIVMQALLTSDHFFSANVQGLHDHEPRGLGGGHGAQARGAHAHAPAARGAAPGVARCRIT
ncbi:MAG: DUF1800 family protein [Flavobacteriales bacterium]|nr:DUF1800 family protein [Flavobacteriales bacterium]